MNRANVVRHIPLMISLLLITGVMYVLLMPPSYNNTERNNAQFKAEILSELAALETRLAQQLQHKDSQFEVTNNLSGEELDMGQMTLLNKKIERLMKLQEQYQQRLQYIEKHLLAELSKEQFPVDDQSDIAVLSMDTHLLPGAQSARLAPIPETSQEREALAVARVKKQIAGYEAKMYEEGPDKQWAATVEQRVLNVLNETEQLSGVHLQTSDCGVTMCKLEVYVEEGESVEQKVQMLMVNRPWDGESFVSFDFDGHGSIYFAREGAELP